MKTIIITKLILLSACLAVYNTFAFNLGGINNKNYLLTFTYKEAVTICDVANENNYNLSYSIYDRFGRESRNVVYRYVLSGTTYSDLVAIFKYDRLGRPYKSYLPKTAANSHHIQDAFFIEEYPMYEYFFNDSAAYIQYFYEESTLNRRIAEIGAGHEWHKADKKNTSRSCANGNNLYCNVEIKRISINDNKIISVTGNYAPAALSGAKNIDEDGNESYRFYDIMGNVVFTRQINYGANHDTYFVYDAYNNLAAVIPPAAADNISDNYDLTVDPYVYLYNYDEYGRVTEKKLPGADPVYYVYDKADRLIFSQSGNQREKNKWSFYRYDQFGRTIIWGEVNMDATNTRQYLADRYKNSVFTETLTPSDGILKGYTNTYTVNSSEVPYIVNYYDNYNFLQLPQLADKSFACEGISYNSKPRSLLTGRYTAALGQNDGGEYVALYYDDYDNLVFSTSDILDLWQENTTYQYNFLNQPVNKTHNFTWFGDTNTEVYDYLYDYAGRLAETRYKYGENQKVSLSKNEYSQILGDLYKKMRYNKTDTITYNRNSRGWITNITTRDYSQKLYYQNSPADFWTTPCYNGNVSAAEINYNGYIFKQGYNYDQMNRLTGSSTKEPTHSQVTFSESLDYDKMGNTTSIYRVYGPYTNTQYMFMEYDGNQIKKVNANTQNPYPSPDQMRYPNMGIGDTEYYYDKNGNLKANLDYGITAIRNNVLNLPDTIQMSNGNLLVNMYLADGRKIGSVADIYHIPQAVTLDNVTKSSDPRTTINQMQFGNVYFENITPTRIYNDEGYISIYDMETNTPECKYYFYDRDYLGNITITDSRNNDDVKQQNRYFPSGSHIELMAQNPELQPYKFGGKEFVSMHGLDWYDFTMRNYSPLTFRFNSIDPLAEKYPEISPYVYCANNPMRYVDLRGDSIITVVNSTENGKTTSTTLSYTKDANGNYGFTDSDGKAYSGGDKFVSNLTAALDNLRSGSTGDALVNDLMNSTNTVNVLNRTKNGAYPDGKKILWDQNSTKGGINELGNENRPAYIGLGHEMAHIQDMWNGTFDNTTWVVIGDIKIPNAEKYATQIENRLRAEHAIPLRTHYVIDISTGKRIGLESTRIIK